MSKSLFFQIFKVTWWPWTKIKVIVHSILLKVLPQTTFGPSLVILVLLVSEILSMFKFRDGRSDGRTDAGGSFYRLTSFHSWAQQEWQSQHGLTCPVTLILVQGHQTRKDVIAYSRLVLAILRYSVHATKGQFINGHIQPCDLDSRSRSSCNNSLKMSCHLLLYVKGIKTTLQIVS